MYRATMWNTPCHVPDTGALTSGHVTARGLLDTIRRRRRIRCKP
jgi:hypothetical protein